MQEAPNQSISDAYAKHYTALSFQGIHGPWVYHGLWEGERGAGSPLVRIGNTYDPWQADGTRELYYKDILHIPVCRMLGT